jgi:hypothetical protein
MELDPVRVRLTQRAGAWRWSSARAHLAGCDDGVVTVQLLFDLVPDGREFLEGGLSAADRELIGRSAPPRSSRASKNASGAALPGRSQTPSPSGKRPPQANDKLSIVSP